MPIPDFDNTLTGRYIRAIENPDSLGWNPNKRIWEAPKQRGTDPNNRGMGVDIVYNEDAAEVVKNRPTKYLTEQEERDLRNDHIDYSYGVIDRHLPTRSSLTPERQAMAAGVIYRGDGKKLQSMNNPLGRAYNVGTDAEFEQAITNFYNKVGLKTRARNHQQFFHNERMQNLMSGIVEAAINSAKDASDFHNTHIKAEGGSLNSHKLWDDLSMTERAEMMRVAVKNGITDLPTIRQKYNEFAEGGPKRDYNAWKKLIHDYKGIDVDNDNTYDYLSYYNNHTDEAWDMLNNAPDAHFYDTYKTVYHPTFSNESVYSGRYDLLHNSKGIVGGRWLDNPNRFIPSSSKRDINSIRETADYISVAEPNGLQIRDEYGRWPIIDGTVFGGVLPQVDISPKVYSNGGPKKTEKRSASTIGNMFKNGLAYFFRTTPNYPVSPYKPTKGNNNITYYAIPELRYDVARNISRMPLTKEPLNTFNDVYNAHKGGFSRQMDSVNLGNYRVDTGSDERGRYISFYDKYDWNFLEELGLGGKPFEIYDRIYEDEWPVYINNLDAITKAEGGKIHIKPENRGKFTALKERTGHSATWFKQHGTPAQRKMATFALNSRKWKHPDGGPLVVDDVPDDYTYYAGSPLTIGVTKYGRKNNRF